MRSRTSILSTVSLAGALLVVAPSEGRSEEGRLEVGAFVGANRSGGFELGNAYHEDQVPRDGLRFGARVRYRLVAGLGVELASSFSPTATAGNHENNRTSLPAPILGLRARASYDLLRWRRVRPFAFAGVGADTVLISAPEDYLVERDTDLTAHWGIGARVAIGDRYGIRADAQQVVAGGRHTAISTGYEAMLGFYVTLGGSPSRPRSVRPKAVAAPKRTPRRAVAKSIRARGPLLPTIPPAAQAALEPAVMRTTHPEVPVTDPSYAEPEESGPAPDETASPTLDRTRARYKKGSARITRRVRRVLDDVAAYLNANPSAIVTVAGHADDEGSDRTNLALSRKRADYAKWYLVDRGVAASRIDTIGYADTRPLRSNSTAHGRAVNRRIEIHVLE